jgi:phospholipase C
MDTRSNPGSRITPAALTRRRLLKGAAGIASAAAATLMPPNVRRMLAQQQPRSSSLADIKHVVILMQENRSFDHYFGTLAGVRGFNDPDALKLFTGQSVFYQPRLDGAAEACRKARSAVSSAG